MDRPRKIRDTEGFQLGMDRRIWINCPIRIWDTESFPLGMKQDAPCLISRRRDCHISTGLPYFS